MQRIFAAAALAALLVALPAFAAEKVFRIDLASSPITVMNPCGEAVVLDEGVMQLVINSGIDGAGTVHVSMKTLYKSAAGYGTVTGARYSANAAVDQYNFSGSAEGFSYQSRGVMKLASAASSFAVRYMLNVTYDPQAGIDVRVDRYEAACK